MNYNRIFLIAMLAILPAVSFSQNIDATNAQQKTEQYFDSIKNNSSELLAFLENIPKGGDLHNHLSGAIYPEELIRIAQNDDLCFDQKTFSVSQQQNCKTFMIHDLTNHDDIYNDTINNWSLRNFHSATETKHDHFFAIFGKISPIVSTHNANVLTEIISDAAAENIHYLELMIDTYDLNMPTGDGDPAGALGSKLGWNANLPQFRQSLLSNGMPQIVQQLKQHIDSMVNASQAQMHCGTSSALPGCKVKVNFIYITLREQPPERVFAELLSAFELANSDSKVVGINIVQAEDSFIALRDYDLHMRMIGYLHNIFPKVHISLHAGELNPNNVTPENMRFHIRDAVEIAKTERIGHGSSVAFENNSQQLLQEMAQKHILVEMNLTSNADLLGISGDDDPLPLYLKYHVPVALSTDDEGILRTTLTREFERAILTYHLSYPTIKNMVRNSITYSFLPGESIWNNSDQLIVTDVCKNDSLGATNPSTSCQQFLQNNEKAQMQWQIENEFNQFENNIAKQKS